MPNIQLSYTDIRICVNAFPELLLLFSSDNWYQWILLYRCNGHLIPVFFWGGIIFFVTLWVYLYIQSMSRTLNINNHALSDGAVKYVDCTSAEEYPHKIVLGMTFNYLMVRLQLGKCGGLYHLLYLKPFSILDMILNCSRWWGSSSGVWGMWSAPSLPLLSGRLCLDSVWE